jgi:hypothetical protein
MTTIQTTKRWRKLEMTDSTTLTRYLDFAIQLMLWLDGKEHFLALGKVFLFSLFLGGT